MSAQKNYSTDSNNHTMRAVTVKQLKMAAENAADEQYLCDGHPIHNVTMVGELTQVQDKGTQTDLVLNDGTGAADVKVFITGDEDPAETFQVGAYVRIYGHLRNFGEELHVKAYTVRPVANWTEAIQYHNLQVMFQHIHLLKGGGRGAAAPQADAMTLTTPLGAATGGFVNMGDDSRMTAVQAAICDLVNMPAQVANTAGMTVQQITSHFAGRFSNEAIQKACTWLTDEGHTFDVGNGNYCTTKC